MESYSVDTTNAVAQKVQEEISLICTDEAKSILKSENMSEFSWDQVWSEFQEKLPNLVLPFTKIIPDTKSTLIYSVNL